MSFGYGLPHTRTQPNSQATQNAKKKICESAFVRSNSFSCQGSRQHLHMKCRNGRETISCSLVTLEPSTPDYIQSAQNWNSVARTHSEKCATWRDSGGARRGAAHLLHLPFATSLQQRNETINIQNEKEMNKMNSCDDRNFSGSRRKCYPRRCQLTYPNFRFEMPQVPIRVKLVAVAHIQHVNVREYSARWRQPRQDM